MFAVLLGDRADAMPGGWMLRVVAGGARWFGALAACLAVLLPQALLRSDVVLALTLRLIGWRLNAVAPASKVDSSR
ncbi:hypothetical protein C8K18_12724 [Paraburkholderia sp. GV068]|nr:hypothetical protein C8K19_12724 [Paraburkholderia sp. GV072]PUA93888.1 hypothetical protein C8K18_12724 [Paraburkholderia sp. GV068]